MYRADDNKELLILFCKSYEKVERILSGFLDLGVTGGTVVDAKGMGELISDDIPVFAGLRSMLKKGNLHTHVLMSVIEKPAIPDAFSLIQSICGDLTKPGTGLVITVPISRILGSPVEIP